MDPYQQQSQSQDSLYFVSQRTVQQYPVQTQLKSQVLVGADDLLNYSQISDNEHLPDSSMDNSHNMRESDNSLSNDPTLGLGLFSFFDPGSSPLQSAIQSKQRPSGLSQS